MLRLLARRLLAFLSVTTVALGGLYASEALAQGSTCGPVRDPEWVRGAVVYGVVPSIFGERPFQAVTQRLDSLRELGVDVLWLLPVNETQPDDFGYAVTDYFALRPDYGTQAEFKELIRQAHARGIKVWMDFVSSHTSAEHPYYRDVLARGKGSPDYGFYAHDAQGKVTHYFDWAHLPNINYDNPKVSEMMAQAFLHWVREYDVDGFRVDVAWGVKERRPEFWCQLSTELREVKPDVYLLAEAGAHDA